MIVHIRPYVAVWATSAPQEKNEIIYHTRVCTEIEDFANNVDIDLEELRKANTSNSIVRQCKVCINPDYEVLYHGGKHWPEEEIAWENQVQQEQIELAKEWDEMMKKQRQN